MFDVRTCYCGGCVDIKEPTEPFEEWPARDRARVERCRQLRDKRESWWKVIFS